MIKYPVLNSRPIEISRYSLEKNVLKFNYGMLKPYRVPKKWQVGPNNHGPDSSLKAGVNRYKRTIFREDESRVKNLLYTIIDYESKNRRQRTGVEIYCHNGLHSDLIIESDDVYYVIYYKGKLIFANTDTRANQNRLFSYVGVKFEALLCGEPSPVDGSHFKLLLEGKYGRWAFKSVVEVDSYRKHGKKTIEQMELAERLQNYCEIKLCYTDKLTPEKVKELKNKQELLEFLKRNVKSFKHKIQKWLYQVVFGRQDYLVIGVRTADFRVLCCEEFHVETEFLPFVEKTYNSLYQQFLKSVDTLDEKYGLIFDAVQALQVKETDVFKLNCKTMTLTRVDQEHDEKFTEILIPEYLASVTRVDSVSTLADEFKEKVHISSDA